MQQTRVRAVALPLVAGGEWVEDAGEQQIPFGNDNKKGKGIASGAEAPLCFWLDGGCTG